MKMLSKFDLFESCKGNGHNVQSITMQGSFIYVLEEEVCCFLMLIQSKCFAWFYLSVFLFPDEAL